MWPSPKSQIALSIALKVRPLVPSLVVWLAPLVVILASRDGRDAALCEAGRC